ncbi:hypothetical protein [Paractinoplanes globisporus]|uniref:Uncharacterized protein n=1 Tax=Paractinoplanes globisporus TaxID=113565 RepID=A0ABW6W405_9ACTN|nr:hypothetical protein [Actinoplanes globisporus]
MNTTSGVRRAIAATIGLLAVAGCAGTVDKAGGTKPGRTLTLRVLNIRDITDLGPIADRVDALSRGTLRLDGPSLWGQGRVTAEVEAIREIQKGSADLAIIPARAWHEAGVTSFDALIAPLAVDSMALQERVLSSELPAEMLADLSRLGLDGIGILPGPMRKPMGITRPLLGPSSYRNATIAYNRSAVADRAFAELGATAIALPRDGADIRARDGIEYAVAAIPGNNYDATVRSITANVDLWPRPVVVVANHQALRGWSAQQVAWLRAAVGDTLHSRVQDLLTRDHDATAIMCRRARLEFVAATPAQRAELSAALRPVGDWLRKDPKTTHLLARIADLRAGLSPYPEETLSCGDTAGTTTTQESTPFDGTWFMEESEQHWQRNDPEKHPENWGHFVYAFGRGRFAMTQENKDSCTWQYGAFHVDGQTVTWNWLDGGGIAPTGAYNRQGERFVWRWSRYHDTMTLAAISPTDLQPQTWRRVRAAPTTANFSKRCPLPAAAIAW